MLFGGGAGGGGITRTADGGGDWSGLGGKGLSFAEDTSGAAFPTPEVGYIAQGGYGSDVLYRTDDGGATWTQVWPAPTLEPVVGQSLLAAGGSVYGFGPFGTLVRSTDGGATWRAMGSAPNALSAATGQTVFDVVDGPGGTYDLRVSPDAGRTWSVRPLSPQAPVPVTIGFDTAADGLIVGTFGIYHTSDGGRSVTIVNASPPTIHQLNVVSPDAAWVIGDDGALDHSSDGGRTWQRYARPGGAPAMFVSFTDAQHGMALSGNSTTCQARTAPPDCSPPQTGATRGPRAPSPGCRPPHSPCPRRAERCS